MAHHKDGVRKTRNIRRILIEPFKQIKLGLYVIAVALAFVCLSGALFVHSFQEQYNNVMEIFNVVDPKGKWDVVNNNIFQANLWKLGILLFAFIGTLFWVVFRSTHKFYGPLVSIERFVEEMSQGNYRKRVVIRKGDEFQNLAKSLNDMAAKLEERHGSSLPERRRRDAKNDQEAS